jgi:hypothetical protein
LPWVVIQAETQPSRAESAEKRAGSTQLADSTTARSHGEIEIVHDFGVLPLGQRVSHDFVIRNPTSIDWTLVKVQRNCTCSVAKASSQTIRVGGEETFRFDYHAPSKPSDERRWVTATFRDSTKSNAAAPPDSTEHEVRLVVTAFVRPALLVYPEMLNFGHLAMGDRATRTLEVGNFGATDWSDVRLARSASWLTARVSRNNRTWGGAEPRQTWVVTLEANTAGLTAGAHHESVQLESNTGDSAALPIDIFAGLPVRVSPTLLMLGRVAPTRAVSTQTTLRFFADKAPCEPHAAVVTARGVRLTGHTIAATRSGYWVLKSQFEPEGQPGEYVSGELRVSFPGKVIADVVVPVHAQMEPNPSNSVGGG